MSKKEAENKKVASTEPVKKAPAKKAVSEVTAEKPVARPAVPRSAQSADEGVKPAKKPLSRGANAPLSHGVGRRKAAVARVWLRRGKGTLIVNEKEHVRYFDTELSRAAAALPFDIYPEASRYDVEANVRGGGLPAQADAVKLGFARALVEINPEIRPLLRQHGLLTVDSRVKERKKYGQKAARRKFQFVKR